MKENTLASNKKALFNYEILETYEAGIVLVGTEVKSLRDHGGSINEAYIIETKGELWLINSSIAPYKFGGAFNHKERRKRKLLMKKGEILKLKRLKDEKGMSLIPLALYLNKQGTVKVKIAVAKGKKAYDKRAKIKEREEKKSISRLLKY